MTERTQRLSRRNFLLTASLGGAAAAAAIVVKNSVSTQQAADGSKRATRGYHATEHVNNYYRTTQV